MSVISQYDRRRRFQENSLTTARQVANQSAESFAYAPRPAAPVHRFFCQLAHGSPTGIICGFRTVRELHTKIAQCFDLNFSDIMYCTLNTHKLDVDKVLGYEIGLNDFIFAHVRGQPKEITMRKQCDSLGMTLADTGCGTVFIKRIQPGGTIAHVSECSGGLLEVGDQVERVNDVSFVGRRHHELAAYLKRIPIGSTFMLRVVSPEKSSIYMLNPRGRAGAHASDIRHDKRTIRFHGNGVVEERVVLDEETENVRRINQVLGTNLGFEDDELARTLYIIAEQSSNPYEMMTAIESEPLRMYYIPTEVMYQIWTVVCQPRRYSPMGGVNIWHKDCYARQDKHNIPVMRMRRRL